MIGCTAGAFLGGITGGLLGMKAYVMTKNTILALPVFQDTILAAAVVCLVTLGVSFALTYFLYQKEQVTKSAEEEAAKLDADAIQPVVAGQRIALEEVNDEVFSKKMMGNGVAYIPTDSKIRAPFDGTVAVVYPTKHAYGLVRQDGLEAIIHIGIDTVNENGAGFTSYVKQDQKVKAGEVIAEADFAALQKKGYDTTTMLVFPQADLDQLDFAEEKRLQIAA